MSARTKTALGIEVGSRRISAALVEKSDRGVKVLAAATGDLPAGEVKRRAARPGKALARVLRQLGGRGRLRSVRTAIATPAGSVIMRLLDLPKQMPTNLGEFVEGELRQYVAMSGRSMSSDFCGIGCGSGSRKRLLAVAADAGEVGETLKMARAAGVVAQSVEPAALAYARVILSVEKDMRRDHTMLATLTHGNLILCVFSNGILDFVRIRDVPSGMNTPESLRTWLAEEFNAVLRYSHANASDASSRWQARLVVLDAAFDKDQLSDLPALESNVDAVKVVDGHERIAALWEGAGETSGPSLVAVGAALKLLDVDGDELRIDLTPQDVIEARSSSRRGLIAANIAAVAFVSVFLFIQLLARTTDAMNRRIERNRIEQQLCTMPTVVAQDRYLDAEILRMTRELAGLKAVRERREVDWPAVLHTIGRAATTGVGVTHMTCGDDVNLVLTGLALSHNEVKTFAQNLDGAPSFASVQLARVQRSESAANVLEYEIHCVLKTMNQECDSGQRS